MSKVICSRWDTIDALPIDLRVAFSTKTENGKDDQYDNDGADDIDDVVHEAYLRAASPCFRMLRNDS